MDVLVEARAVGMACNAIPVSLLANNNNNVVLLAPNTRAFFLVFCCSINQSHHSKKNSTPVAVSIRFFPPTLTAPFILLQAAIYCFLRI